MREFLRGVVRKLRWLWRLASVGSDVYTFWSLKSVIRETVLSIWGAVALAVSLLASSALGVWTSMSGLSRVFVVIGAIGAFLLVFTLLIAVSRLVQARRAGRKEEKRPGRAAAKYPANQSSAQQPTAPIAPPQTPVDELRRKIQKWQTEIENGNFTRTGHGHSQFCETKTYVEMEPYLRQHVKDRMRSHHGAVIAWLRSPHLKGTEGDRRAMIGELARIQEEWGVH